MLAATISLVGVTALIALGAVVKALFYSGKKFGELSESIRVLVESGNETKLTLHDHEVRIVKLESK